MSQQDQYGRHRYLTFFLPQNNMEVVCPNGFRKGMCHTESTETGKKKKYLYMINHSVISNFFSIFYTMHPCLLPGNIFSCTSTYGV